MPAPETRFAVLLFTDIVDSTELKARHGVPAYSAALSAHNAHFERLAQECLNLRTLQRRGDGYFIEAGSVTEAVRFALLFQEVLRAEPWSEVRLTTRIGIHAGEVGALEAGDWIVGPAADLAARVTDLAVGGQILLTRFPFDEARHFIREHPAVDGKTMPPLRWLAHGPYLMKGRDEPLEVFEVGAEGLAPLSAPPDGGKAKRAIRPGEEETLGWRPAVGLEIPGRTGWQLTERLGAGGFGEVWIGEHAKFRQRRAFKFCFDDERLRALKREVTLVRLLRSALGERDDIVHIHELKLDAPPFYLESDLAPHGNLLQWAERQGDLGNVPLPQRIGLVAHTAIALAAAHRVGVLHKDIKPTNILIFDGPNGEPRPRLVDFGIGTLADPTVLAQHGVTGAGFTRATVEHSTGTPTYSPPEYLAGKPYTVQGDIYGLGILLYQLITARPRDPLAQGWERDILDPLLREDIAACVDGDPDRRLPSAADLADRLLHLEQRRVELEERARQIREEATRIKTERIAAEARARQMRNRRIAVGLFVIAILCMAGGWLGSEYLASTSPGRVEIMSEPSGAEVWREGQKVGVTPFKEKHPAGKQIAYILKAPGFEDMYCAGILSPRSVLTVQVPLRRMAPLEMTQTPPFAIASASPPKPGPAATHEQVRLASQSIPVSVPAAPPPDAVKVVPKVKPTASHVDPPQYVGEVREIEGVVEFKQADQMWSAAPVGTKLRTGDRLRTKKDSRVQLTLRDLTILRLGEDAEIALSGPKEKPAIIIQEGSVYWFRGSQGEEIEIKTPAANGVIRG